MGGPMRANRQYNQMSGNRGPMHAQMQAQPPMGQGVNMQMSQQQLLQQQQMAQM